MNQHTQQVIENFGQTHNDYRRLWGIDRHLGLHCGYFDETHSRHDDAVLNMNRVLANTARIAPGDRILDAGCGIGGSSFWLVEHFDDISVTRININEMQIAIANEYVRTLELQSTVNFRVADFVQTGLNSASFDVVWALESMCYADDKQAFGVVTF